MNVGRAGRAAAVVLAFLASASLAGAQSGASVKPVARDGVWLIVRPRVGDTLRLQLEQTIEISGRRITASQRQGPAVIDGSRKKPSSPAPDYGPRRDRAATRVTRLQLFAHSLVEASTLQVTTLLATTDSMAMSAGSAQEASAPLTMMPLPADGRQVRVRVTPDGTMRVSDPPPGAMELGSTLASMPGMLPNAPVQVGESWERDIVLPSVPLSGYRADGVVRARFRLDSLTRGGRDAWISMEGTLQRDGAGRELPAGTRVITAGTMRGSLVVDRVRAWIVDARTTMDVQSEVTPGPAGPATPMLLDMHIVQRVRVK